MLELYNHPIVQFVLFVSVLFLAGQLALLLEAKRREANNHARDNRYDSLYWALDRASEIAVQAVEQLTRSGEVKKFNEDRRDKAVEFIISMLEAQGYHNVPVENIIVAVEKAVYVLFNRDKQSPTP